MIVRSLLLVAWLMVSSALAEIPNVPGDRWFTNEFRYPASYTTSQVNRARFEGAHVEVQAGRLKIVWPTPIDRGTVFAVISIDDPGHWPSRDWFSLPLIRHAGEWEGRVSVENLDTSVIYFLGTSEGLATNISPARLCNPREAGLEQPDQFFWSFLEGFEEGTERWRDLSGRGESLRVDPMAHRGRGALLISLPAGRRSASAGTARLRGAAMVENGVTGLRLWMRTRSGEGHARFTLWSDAFSSQQSQRVFEEEPLITDRWKRIELIFSKLAPVSIARVDFFSVEVIGDGPCDFLLDDLEMMVAR